MIERIPITSREQWLDLRRHDITASDVAAVCGLSPYKSALRLWAEKTGEVSEGEENNAMRRGRWLEAGVISALNEEYPTWAVHKLSEYLRDPEIRIGATPDALAYTPDETIVQCKVISAPSFESGWKDGPPVGYQLQTLTEAMLWDAPTAYLAALVIDTYGAELHVVEVPRHPAAEAKIRETVARFWSDVEAGKVPAVDYAKDSELLKILYRPKEGMEPIDLSADNLLPEILAEREKITADLKSLEDRKKEIGAEIIHKLNGSAVGLCDGWKIQHSTTNRPEHVVKATSFPVLRVSRIKEKTA